jgi:hypothetical protein
MTTSHEGIRASGAFAGAGSGGRTALMLAVVCLSIFSLAGCSNLTGWRIPGTEKSELPTTKVYLVLENVETLPEELRTQGEIYVDDAFFGHTSRPTYYRFVGNALVVGTVQIEKEKTHTVRVTFPNSGDDSGSETRSPAVADSGSNHSERSFCLLEFQAIVRFFSPAAGFSCAGPIEAGSFRLGFLPGKMSQTFVNNRPACPDGLR